MEPHFSTTRRLPSINAPPAVYSSTAATANPIQWFGTTCFGSYCCRCYSSSRSSLCFAYLLLLPPLDQKMELGHSIRNKKLNDLESHFSTNHRLSSIHAPAVYSSTAVTANPMIWNHHWTSECNLAPVSVTKNPMTWNHIFQQLIDSHRYTHQQ